MRSWSRARWVRPRCSTYDRKKLRGLVLEEGGPTSHVSIVARALGIAAVGQIANATGIVDPGDAIIVDGTMGHVYVRPTPDVEKNYADRVRCARAGRRNTRSCATSRP
jgi:phosphotransferase system enzyme I (PtsP)